MKKAPLASMLAVSALAFVAATPGTLSRAGVMFAQGSGQVTLDPAEFADYDAANKQSTPQAQAPALEAYLAKYPKSPIKSSVLETIMADYYKIAAQSGSAADQQKAVDAADKVLADNPNSLQAEFIEVSFRSAMASSQTDPAAKQAGLDAAASAAQKGLAITTPPTGMSSDQFKTLTGQLAPTFYSTIGAAALNKQDYAGAISAYKSELQATPVAQTQAVGTALQDTYLLGTAYFKSTPPDLLDCTFYTTRAASYAPDQFKTQFQPLATYCYKKFHGGTDGYDTLVVPVAKANVMPPDGFAATIKPAPTNEDIVKQTIASTPDLSTLALSDKEFILQYGSSDDSNKVFDTIKGKTVEIPDGTIVAGSTADSIMVSVSDDAVQSKVADFTFNMKTPLKTVPAAGTKITLTGTYTSFKQSPIMIVMSDGEEVVKKAAPTRRPTTTRRPR